MDSSLLHDISLMRIFVSVLAVAFYIGTLVWVYEDARERGMNGLMVAFLVAFVIWPVSLLTYILFRPKSSSRSVRQSWKDI